LAGRSVVIIVADALNADHLSCYGHHHATSPRMDELAERGVRFAHAYSQTAWTLSSVASLFTSMEQERHGVLRQRERLGEEPSTLAELFRDKGYRTVCLLQNRSIGIHTGLNRGFDLYEDYRWSEEGMEQIAARAREVLLEEDTPPLFAYLHLRPPHGPYQPPVRFRNRFNPGYEGYVDGSVQSQVLLRNARGGPEDPDTIQMAALYDEHITWVDTVIGELVEDIEKAGREDEFLFVITSDHGEAFMEHGSLGHNTQVYEEMIRVPLILYAPHGPFVEGQSIQEPVFLLDLFPTLIELCALDTPPRQRMDGTSLAALLEAPDTTLDRPLFFTSRYTKTMEDLHLALRVGKYKLVRPGMKEKSLLFDLEDDPRETHDLADDLPKVTQGLESMLRDWFTEVTEERKNRGTNEEAPLPDAVHEELKALGYTGDG
jgi:arylsulfatase